MKFQLLIKGKMMKNKDFSYLQAHIYCIYHANNLFNIMSMIYSMLSLAEHEKSSITLRPDLQISFLFG